MTPAVPLRSRGPWVWRDSLQGDSGRGRAPLQRDVRATANTPLHWRPAREHQGEAAAGGAAGATLCDARASRSLRDYKTGAKRRLPPCCSSDCRPSARNYGQSPECGRRVLRTEIWTRTGRGRSHANGASWGATSPARPSSLARAGGAWKSRNRISESRCTHGLDGRDKRSAASIHSFDGFDGVSRTAHTRLSGRR